MRASRSTRRGGEAASASLARTGAATSSQPSVHAPAQGLSLPARQAAKIRPRLKLRLVRWRSPERRSVVSILVTFGPVEMTREEYLKVGDRLPDPPEGRDYHVCAGDDGA